MPIFSKDGRNILFLHIPKCGGSSITSAFERMGYTVLLQMSGLPIQKTLTASPQHLTITQIKPLLQLNEIQEVFTVVRNPYSRLISEYNWVTRRILDPALIPSFESWVVEQIYQARANPNHADNHIRPMIDFLSADIPCRIFRHESGLNIVTEFYCDDELLEAPPMGRRNQSSSLSSPARTRSSLSEIILHLPDETLALINDYYSNDFTAFCYPLLSAKRITNETRVPDLRQAPDFGRTQELANSLALSHQECISTLSSKLVRLRSSIKETRKQDLENFASQLKSEAVTTKAQLDQLAAELQEERQQLKDARSEADQMHAKLQQALEELEQYCLISNECQQNLGQALQELNWNRNQLKRMATIAESNFEYQHRALEIITRLILATPLESNPEIRKGYLRRAGRRLWKSVGCLFSRPSSARLHNSSDAVAIPKQ